MATSDVISQAITNLQNNIAAFQAANQTLFNQLAAAQAQIDSLRAQIQALPGFADIQTAQNTIIRLRRVGDSNAQQQGQQLGQ